MLRYAVGEGLLSRAEAFDPPALPDFADIPRAGASRLRIEVHGTCSEPVSLTLPAAAALDLETLIPVEILDRIRERGGILLEEIRSRLLRTGLAPQELFALDHQGSRYRVWLD